MHLLPRGLIQRFFALANKDLVKVFLLRCLFWPSLLTVCSGVFCQQRAQPPLGASDSFCSSMLHLWML